MRTPVEVRSASRFVSAMIAVALSVSTAPAETRTSPNYALTAETHDTGGQRISSASYSADSSIGAIGTISTATSPPLITKSGYVGQLCEPTGMAIGASPTNINEGTTRQLSATQIMDDSTFLTVAASSVSWGVLSGPINSVSAGGIATAGNVYQHSPATVHGSVAGFSASLGLLVVNVTSDDFGLYAGDGIDDDWQVFYFGEGSPDAAPGRDPDHDGRDNLFESLALTVPTEASSLFQLRAMPTPNQFGKVDLVFGPIRAGRTYTVLYSMDLSPSGWGELSGTTQGDDGEQRTVTDPGAGGTRKFYRVQIGR